MHSSELLVPSGACVCMVQATKAAEAAEEARFAAEWKVFARALKPKASSIIQRFVPLYDEISNPVCALVIYR